MGWQKDNKDKRDICKEDMCKWLESPSAHQVNLFPCLLWQWQEDEFCENSSKPNNMWSSAVSESSTYVWLFTWWPYSSVFYSMISLGAFSVCICIFSFHLTCDIAVTFLHVLTFTHYSILGERKKKSWSWWIYHLNNYRYFTF